MPDAPPTAPTPEDVLAFWFADTVADPSRIRARSKMWYGGGEAVDREIAARFEGLPERLAAGEADIWAAQGPRGRLAAVIALDQFPRNLHRGTPRAFALDPVAQRLTHAALASGQDVLLAPIERWFLYMPLEHSEDAADQQLSVACFARLLHDAPAAARTDFEGALAYARRHADAITRFGRFPRRNKALGRISTAEEEAFLKTSPEGF